MENSDLEETLILAFVSMIVFLSEVLGRLKGYGINDPLKQDGG